MAVITGIMPQEMDMKDFAQKLQEQADDYREYRYALYEKVDLKSKKRILDLGCGTGVITADIASLTEGDVTGVDISKEMLTYARDVVEGVTLINADILNLPFKDNTFDLVVFTVVLTHIREQQKAVDEMVRVTQKGGCVLATMEPDYAGACYYPESEIYPLFLALDNQKGTVVHTGRKLRSLFSTAGLTTEMGMYTGDIEKMNRDVSEQVEELLSHFWYIEKLLLRIGWEPSQIEKYKQEQIELMEKGEFFGFIPAFYAIGKKPGYMSAV
jgi:ubiquinone/menaquinone biosynthesis C-methylase UbiE